MSGERKGRQITLQCFDSRAPSSDALTRVMPHGTSHGTTGETGGGWGGLPVMLIFLPCRNFHEFSTRLIPLILALPPMP